MASSPKVPEALPPPAKKPVRKESTAPEDIVLGGIDELDEKTPNKLRGKRSLSRPASGVAL